MTKLRKITVRKKFPRGSAGEALETVRLRKLAKELRERAEGWSVKAAAVEREAEAW